MSLIRTENLNKKFKLRKLTIPAVENLNVEISHFDFFALVGESGSGKSTVVRLILRLLKPDEGEIIFKGQNLWQLKGFQLKSFHQSIGVVFQDPYASLNPRMKIFSIVEEPLKIHKKIPQSEIAMRVEKIISDFGLDSTVLSKYPHQLSGGQRQRVAIARALILEPELLIADEPLSALDISLQASILNHLIKLRERRKFGVLLITHDLNVVRAVSNRIGVMHLGRIVEEANTVDIFKEPLHPYTKALLSSIPGYHRRNRNRILRITTEERDSWKLIGCRFYNRCKYRMNICYNEIPKLKELNGRKVRCFLY